MTSQDINLMVEQYILERSTAPNPSRRFKASEVKALLQIPDRLTIAQWLRLHPGVAFIPSTRRQGEWVFTTEDDYDVVQPYAGLPAPRDYARPWDRPNRTAPLIRYPVTNGIGGQQMPRGTISHLDPQHAGYRTAGLV